MENEIYFNSRPALVFLFYGVGMTLGLLVFMLEKLLFRYSRKSTAVLEKKSSDDTEAHIKPGSKQCCQVGGENK